MTAGSPSGVLGVWVRSLVSPGLKETARLVNACEAEKLQRAPFGLTDDGGGRLSGDAQPGTPRRALGH